MTPPVKGPPAPKRRSAGLGGTGAVENGNFKLGDIAVVRAKKQGKRPPRRGVRTVLHLAAFALLSPTGRPQ